MLVQVWKFGLDQSVRELFLNARHIASIDLAEVVISGINRKIAYVQMISGQQGQISVLDDQRTFVSRVNMALQGLAPVDTEVPR